MRALLDASQDEILLVSTDGAVLVINKAARARLAYRSDWPAPRSVPSQRPGRVEVVCRLNTRSSRPTDRRAMVRVLLLPGGSAGRRRFRGGRVRARNHRAEASGREPAESLSGHPAEPGVCNDHGSQRAHRIRNPKFTEITGYTLAEAIGQNPRILTS